MHIHRRSFLTGLAAAVALGACSGRHVQAAESRCFVSARTTAEGGADVAVFSLDGELLFSTRLPERGHDIALHPQASELVVFARRPGNWAAVIDSRSGAVKQVITSPPGRHFFGHGAFSPDGAWMYATENDVASGQGVLGVYDTRAGYARIREVPTFGIGPHDLARLPGGGFVVANGGIRTQPETGRDILNKDSMSPSLAVLDPATGEQRLGVDLGADMRALSIRHLAVAADSETVFGCQFMGDASDMPPLVGVLRADGTHRFLEMPDDDLARLKNYIGSVSLDSSQRIIAATSPHGGVAAFWERASGRYLGSRALPDVCGVAPTGEDGVFLVSSGNAGVRMARLGEAELRRVGGGALDGAMWDNHMRVIVSRS